MKLGDTEITTQSEGEFLPFLGPAWKKSKIPARTDFM